LPKALEYGEKAIQAAKTNENRLAALADKCRTLYYMNRVDEFNTCYEECMEQVKRYGDFRGNVLKKIRIFKFLLDGDYDRALLAADSVGSLMEVYQMREIIYLKLGDYEKAYISNAKIHNYRDSVNLQVQTSDLAELNNIEPRHFISYPFHLFFKILFV
jgi:tetratricopeptide (TPR) repeat protein